MAEKPKRRFFLVALSAVFVLLLGWMVVTCATDPVARKSFTHAFIHDPAPTPLPALPADGAGKIPGYGEPPVPVYDSAQRDEMDNLPVGNSKDLIKKDSEDAKPEK